MIKFCWKIIITGICSVASRSSCVSAQMLYSDSHPVPPPGVLNSGMRGWALTQPLGGHYPALPHPPLQDRESVGFPLPHLLTCQMRVLTRHPSQIIVPVKKDQICKTLGTQRKCSIWVVCNLSDIHFYFICIAVSLKLWGNKTCLQGIVILVRGQACTELAASWPWLRHERNTDQVLWRGGAIGWGSHTGVWWGFPWDKS